MSGKRKDYFSGSENIPQVCIVERHGGSAHLLGGIHHLTSSSERYNHAKKAQVKTHLLETVCKNANNQAAKCLFFMRLNLRKIRRLLGCIFMRLVFHTCQKAQGMIFADFPQISRSGSADFPLWNPCKIRENEKSEK
jgi:hypothetical protein